MVFLLTIIMDFFKISSIIGFFINLISIFIFCKVLKLRKRFVIILFVLLVINLELMSLDIVNYFNYYQEIGYTKYTSIYSENVLNFLIAINIPFFGIFEILKKLNVLEYRYYIIPIVIIIPISIFFIVNVIVSKFKLNKK